MPAFIDLSGRKFDRLTVVERIFKQTNTNRTRTHWRCICVCGREKTAESSHLTSGGIRSCGCLQKEKTIENGKRNRTHGNTAMPNGGKRTKEYGSWCGMKARCHNPNDPAFNHYGARGITVCDSWFNDFHAFLADMGKAPSANHSIDRIDNNKGYSQDNCRWATKSEQNRNTRRTKMITHNGITKPLADWSDIVGLDQGLIWCRLLMGWSDSEAVSTPVGVSRHAHPPRL